MCAHLHPHLHLVSLQVDVQTRDLRALHRCRHALRRTDAVQRVARLYLGVQQTQAVALEDVHGGHGVFHHLEDTRTADWREGGREHK